MMTLLRFAPSPTGYLHIGNARTAVLNFLFASKYEGRFLLRIDDTDLERSEEVYREALYRDLSWLGLSWHDSFRQAERLDHYEAALTRLKEIGRLYPCYETPEELDLKKKRQRARGRPPVYDREALGLSQDAQKKYQQAGRRPYWRFRLNEQRTIAWHDLVKGPIQIELSSLSDPVLVRANGQALYTLSSVVDDGATRVTHILRGEDHIANTAVQVDLFEALGLAVPAFGHYPLLVDGDGRGLSKRLGSLTLHRLREEGVEPEALFAYLARLGTPHAARADLTLESLVDSFQPDGYGRAAPRFEENTLRRLSAAMVRLLPWERVAPRLEPYGLHERAWLVFRPNLDTVETARLWHAIVENDLPQDAAKLEAAEHALATRALALLPSGEHWHETALKAWLNQLRRSCDNNNEGDGDMAPPYPDRRRNVAWLFRTLRRLLTGLEAGPELVPLCQLLGESKVRRRLEAGQIAPAPLNRPPPPPEKPEKPGETPR